MEFRTITGGEQPFVISQEGEGPDIVLPRCSQRPVAR